VTNTGVEGTDEPMGDIVSGGAGDILPGELGDILPGEDNTLTISEMHDHDCEFVSVYMYVCIKKVHTVITDLD
jgi:hypothetical protein